MSPSLDAQWRLRAAAFLSSFDRFTIPPLIVPIHRDLGISLASATVLASTYFVAYGLSQVPWGVCSDRIGRVAVLRIAVLGGSACSLAATVAEDLTTLAVARGLAGLFFGAAVPTAVTYLGDSVAGKDRQQALAALLASATAGLASSAVISGVTVELLGWRAVFLLSAGLGFVVLALVWRLAEPSAADHAPLGRRLLAIGRRGWVWVVVALAFVEGVVIFGALTFVAASLQDAGSSAAVAGAAAAGFGVTNVLVTPLITRAVPRVSSPQLIAGGAGLVAVGLALPAASLGVGTVAAAALALGAGFGFVHSTLQLWATEVHPTGRAITVSLFTSALFTGGAAASAAAAPLADDGRFETVFLIAALTAAFVAVAGAALRRTYLVHHPETATPTVEPS